MPSLANVTVRQTKSKLQILSLTYCKLRSSSIGLTSSKNTFQIWRQKLWSSIFLNGPTPASFSFIFRLFKQAIQFFTTNWWKSSIRCRDSNPWPLEHLPTTKPGAPALWLFFDMVKSVFSYFSQHNDKNKPYKCVDDMIGIQTRARRMVGAEESTEHWCPPHIT